MSSLQTPSPASPSDGAEVDPGAVDARGTVSSPSASDHSGSNGQLARPLIEELPPGLPSPLQAVPGSQAPGRLTVVVALFLIAALSGAALFVAGFTLGQRQQSTAGTPPSLQERFQPFWDAYGKITNDFVGTYDEKKLVEGAISGLFEALDDPYSSYMTSQEYRESLSALTGQFEGIGAEMTTRDETTNEPCSPIGGTCHLLVARPLRNSPAIRAGLQKNDRVLAVDGESVDGDTLDETIARVRGKAGTSVTLTVSRGDAAEFKVTIERAMIETEDVISEVLANGRVGYLRIESFSSSAADDFKDQLHELVADKRLKHLVLDLRDDPGGFVDAALDIASQFIAEGPIYWQEDAKGRREAKEAIAGGVATDADIRIVAIVNENSASATEILAGALQDTGRAVLVGTPTYGKGTIQTWETLEPDSGGFRLTIAKWLTPNQRWINEKGLKPDVLVEAPDDEDPDEDRVLDRAIEVLLEEEAEGSSLRPAA